MTTTATTTVMLPSIPPPSRKTLTKRKVVLYVVNLISTAFTMLTGLRENPVVTSITGHSDLIRSRFMQGRINYNLIRPDLLEPSTLPTLYDVGDRYRFYMAPDRSPANLGEDRSTCIRVNSMNATEIAVNYDDFYGKGARREQVYLYSISAPACHVVNLRPEWVREQCVAARSRGNVTACHEYILTHFDHLAADRTIQVGVPVDFGTPGQPFLRCRRRPPARFEYMTDLMVLQSFWAGGSYHVEVQSSRCWAVPVLRDADWNWGLFQVEPVNQSATVVVAVDRLNWLAYGLSMLYGAVSFAMVLRGLYVALAKLSIVHYVPSHHRCKLFGLLDAPLVGLQTFYTDTHEQATILQCHGEVVMASDLWMNHWLYIALSIMDAVLNVRATYAMLEIGTWMLSKQVSLVNFIFVCSALTKLTWIMCLVHTLFRAVSKIVLQLLRAVAWNPNANAFDQVTWAIDGVAVLVTFRLYSILLCVVLLGILKINGRTSMMGASPKLPIYGGFPGIPNLWGSEIVCDLLVVCSVQLVIAHVLGLLLLRTRFRYAINNRVIQLLQKRYFIVGWNLYTAMDALGIDPFDPRLVHDQVALTHCSFAALLQQLHASGPSGWVEFAGDCVFQCDATRSERRLAATDPARTDTSRTQVTLTRYPIDMARTMGLYTAAHRQFPNVLGQCRKQKTNAIAAIDADKLHNKQDDLTMGEVVSASVPWRNGSDWVPMQECLRLTEVRSDASAAEAWSLPAPPILPFESRLLRLHAEQRWGRLIFVDFQHAPGTLAVNDDHTLVEFAVPNALQFLPEEKKDHFLSRACVLRLA